MARVRGRALDLHVFPGEDGGEIEVKTRFDKAGSHVLSERHAARSVSLFQLVQYAGQNGIDFDSEILPGRFRTTVLTDLYDATKDIKQAQAAAGHTTAAMTLKHYVKGRQAHANTALPIATAYGLKSDAKTDFGKS